MQTTALTSLTILLRLDARGLITEVTPTGAVPLGQPLIELVLPEERKRAQALLAAARYGEPGWAELTLLLPGGMQRCQVASVPGELGTTSWLLRPLPDSRRPPLDDPIALERWLGPFLLEHVEVGILVFDRNLVLRYVNKVAASLLADPATVLAPGVSFIVVQQLLDQAFSAPGLGSRLREAFANGEALRHLELERRDGLVIELDYFPVWDDGDTIAHVLRLRDISAWRTSEQRAARAERRYRELVELLPVVVYQAQVDVSTETSYVSPQIERLLGYSPEEWLGRRGMWVQHLHPDDYLWVIAAIEQALAQDGEFSLEYRMLHRDGHVVWVHDWGRVRRDEHGGRFIHGVMLDVTSRKVLEQAHEEARARLQALLQTNPAVIYAVDPQPVLTASGQPAYRWQYVNEQIEQLTGYSAQEFYARPDLYASLIHPEDARWVSEESLRTDSTGEPFAMDYRLIRRDGSVVWVREYAVLLRDDAGRPLAWQGVIVDVTEQKQLEQMLREAEARYRVLIEQLPGALLVVAAQPTWLPDGTPSFELVYVSPQIEQVTGYPAQAWAEAGFWFRLIHPDDRQQVLDCLKRCLHQRSSQVVEYRLVRADGQIVWIRHETTLVLDENGTPRYWHSLLLDVTAEKQAEEARREAEERFRLLAEHHPAAVTIVEPEPVHLPDGTLGWRTLYTSPRITELTGYTAEEWSALGVWLRSIHPEDRERILVEAQEWYTQGPKRPLEYRFMRKDGRIVWLHQEGALVRDAAGRPRYLYLITQDVTEQRSLFEQLQLAEERYRTLVEQLPGAVLIRPLLPDETAWSRNQPYVYISPGIQRLTGFSPAEWSNERFLAQLHPDDRERVLAATTEADRAAKPIAIEYRLQRKDGHFTWIWSVSDVIRLPGGAPPYRQILMMDITERKRAEEDLRDAEARYRALVEQLPAAVYVEGVTPVPQPDGRMERPLLYISPQVEQLTGYSPEEHQRDRSLWREAIHPDDYSRVRRETRKAWATGRFHSEFRIVHRDGTVRWLESTAQLIRDADGKPLYWQGVMLDVTERKRIEEELRAAEERYRTLVEQIPAAVMVTSATPVRLPDGSLHYPITYLSQHIEDVTGFGPEEFAATPGLWFSRIHPDDQPRVSAEAIRTDETGEPFHVTYRFQRKDGQWVWLENRAVLLRDRHGNPLLWHGLLLDVTERKRREELLVAQTTLLRLIAEAAPLSEVLDVLCRLVEHQAPDLRCSVLLLGSDGRLYHGAAPNLPHVYLAAIEGLEIGPCAGSCGTAAFLNQPVYVSDIDTDPRWADYRDVATRFGLRACWSTPIRDATGRVLGTVALYAFEPRGPRPEEQQLLELATQLAALALERWRESEDLHHRAFHDPLTGLANRLLFLDRLEHALLRAERDGGGLAVLFIDLDDFKRVNDTWGHAAGDLVLQQVAQRLSAQVRAGDTVARFAGDEFMVLLEGVTSPEEVRGVAERLLRTLDCPVHLQDTAVHLSLSIGAALVPAAPYPDSGALLLAADQALYAAKRRGKNTVDITVCARVIESPSSGNEKQEI